MATAKKSDKKLPKNKTSDKKIDKDMIKDSKKMTGKNSKNC